MLAKSIARGLIMLAALLAGVSVAEAGKVPIPCTGEKIVRVADLPAAIDAGNGRHLGLGYLYTGCFSGKWIGHVGSDTQYNAAAGPLLFAAMTDANKGVAPQEPGFLWGLWSHPGQFVAEWIWIVMLSCIAIAIPFRKTPSPQVAALEPVTAERPSNGTALSRVEPATAVSRRRAPRDLNASLGAAQATAFGRRR